MEADNNAPIKFLTINGIKLAYRKAGQGPPLFFIHGGIQDSRAWTPQLTTLADEFTVVAWDEPGAGQSSTVPANFGLSDYADCLAGLTSALDLGNVHLAGLSWGSTLALEFYRCYPQMVRSMILIGGYAGWKGSLGEEEAQTRLRGAQKMFNDPEQASNPTLPGLFHGEPPARFIPLLNAMNADVRLPSMRKELEIMAATDLSDVLATIRVPSLLIWGEHDERSPLPIAREFEAKIPQAQLIIIPNCGHVVNLQQPEAFNAAVKNFCRNHQKG